jgi:hypothetical protein
MGALHFFGSFLHVSDSYLSKARWIWKSGLEVDMQRWDLQACNCRTNGRIRGGCMVFLLFRSSGDFRC